MIIKDIKYTFVDSQFGLGPYIDFVPELEVESYSYDHIVNAIQALRPDCTDIQLLSYTRTTDKGVPTIEAK